MRIAFIRPSLHGEPSRDAMEPLCFGILKALTPRGIETTLHDERVGHADFDAPADLAAITVETYAARRAYQIAASYRRRGVPVVMGGHHPTLLPGEALEHADAIVIGDAEGVWGRVVEEAATGRLRRVYRDDGFPSLDGLRLDRSVFRGRPYVGLTLVQSVRGCRYHCDFCSIHAFYGRAVRQRPVAEVAEEIARARARHVFFVDDNLFVNAEQTRALCEALLPLRVRWSCQMSLDGAQDRDLVRLMARSGCTAALIGFDSLDPENLRQMGKGWSLRHGSAASAIRTLRDSDLLVYGTFVFGYDGDTARAFDETVDFALAERLFLANFNPLTPMPGTALYRRLEREGRLIHDRWWLDPSFRYGQACFHPRGMTAAELTAGCRRARFRFYSGASIARRLVGGVSRFPSPRRMAIYLGANLISRREVKAKQGRALGGRAPFEPAGEPA